MDDLGGSEDTFPALLQLLWVLPFLLEGYIERGVRQCAQVQEVDFDQSLSASLWERIVFDVRE